jgi:hypothetical protein
VFRNFPQSLQENVGVSLKLGIYRFVLFFCLIRYSFLIYAMQSEVLEAVLNKPRINKKGQSKTKKSSPATRHGGAWRERRCSSYSFLTSALDGSEWSASRPGRALPRGKDPCTHWTGGWVGPRAGLDTEVRGKIPLSLPGIEPRTPGRPVCSQTLYCLSYSGS